MSIYDGDDDYAPPPRSERHAAADAIAAALFAAGLRSAADGPAAERSGHGRCWVVRFARAEQKTKGAVLVFGPGWLRVEWKTAAPGMPPAGGRVYASAEEAVAFVLLAFADGRTAAALAVPEREAVEE